MSAFALDIQNKTLGLQDELVGAVTGKVDAAVKEAVDEIKSSATPPPPAPKG